jgi:Flp pilus assembly pilin Flp
MNDRLKRLARDTRGQDLIEYALLAAVISISAVATLLAIGQAIDTRYQRVRDAIGSVP